MKSCSQRPLLSIVIPTRERARYLRYCLNTAVACTGPRIEILVSDNASTDNTTALLAEPQYAGVRYVRTSERVPISLNFESAFANASGQYILYAGDDDAVLPTGIGDLLDVLEKRAPDIVSWPTVEYYWPNDGEDGFLRIKRRRIRGGIQELNPANLMQKFCDGRWSSSAVHCGCVSRRIVQTITSRTGRYFYDTTPDASGFGALAFSRSYIFLNRPVTVYGRSPASNTTALSTSQSSNYAAFVAETSRDIGEDAIDLRCRSMFAVALAGLVLTRRLLNLSTPTIGIETWKERIIRDLLAAPIQSRIEQAGYVNQWLVRNQMAPIDLRVLEQAPANEPFAPKLGGNSKARITLIAAVIASGPRFMRDVESAVCIAEDIIGPQALVDRASWPIAFLRWLGAMARARRAMKQAAAVHKTSPLPILQP